MDYIWFLIFSCSIFIAAGIGWARFRKIAPAFYPFIICIWIGSLNELISIIAAQIGFTTEINNNVYVLAESQLIIWQLKNWNGFNALPRLYRPLLLFLGCCWFAEYVIFSNIGSITPFFRLTYSFVIVIISISVLNNLIISERKSLLRQPAFLIAACFVLYFLYKGMIELFWLNDLEFSSALLLNVYTVFIWINLIANLIYALAILWMPGKHRLTLPY